MSSISGIILGEGSGTYLVDTCTMVSLIYLMMIGQELQLHFAGGEAIGT